jgi:plastocyanin
LSTVTKCRVVAVLVLALLSVPLAASAMTGSSRQGIDVGQLLADLNAASDGAVAVVAMSCLTFEPDILTVASGTTVTWVHVGCSAAPHNAVDLGTTLDPVKDQAKPRAHPVFSNKCFNSLTEQGGNMVNGESYSVQFTLAGIVVRDVATTAMKPCPVAASIDVSSGSPSAVIPYYCVLHGAAQPEGAGMRAAIVVTL